MNLVSYKIKGDNEYEIATAARRNISKTITALRHTAERLKDPELDLEILSLEKALDDIPETFSLEIKINGEHISKRRPYSSWDH